MIIQTKAIRKTYISGDLVTTSLDGIHLAIEEGEFVGIMGPSGCGKSTLLNILGLLDIPTEGSYSFMNQEVSRLPERKRAQLRKGNIGFIFQSFNLVDNITVFENVALPLYYLNLTKQERKIRVLELLDQLNIAHRANHYPQELSGGQQQRVAVARAIAPRPKLILADEPTGNLDSRNGEMVMQLLGQLHTEGATIVMVTHSMAQARRANRIIHLFDGRIVQEYEHSRQAEYID
jgi:putative ABC transport system ATP-binding protein